MKKVAINSCFGGFHLSDEAMVMYLKKMYPDKVITTEPDKWGSLEFMVDGKKFYQFEVSEYDNRENPILIEVIETLGGKADGRYSDLKIVEIPDDVQYEITDYDGVETVEEIHRSWC